MSSVSAECFEAHIRDAKHCNSQSIELVFPFLVFTGTWFPRGVSSKAQGPVCSARMVSSSVKSEGAKGENCGTARVTHLYPFQVC